MYYDKAGSDNHLLELRMSGLRETVVCDTKI